MGWEVGRTARAVALLICAATTSCASSPPSQVENLCGIFREKDGFFDNWRKAALEVQSKYAVPIPVLMATVYQESRFQPKARPRRTRLLWFIPWRRPSSAYGFGQVVDETWEEYMRKTANFGADRDKFKDALDFVGWYHANTHRRHHVPLDDSYHLYLAYHEGQGGFGRRSYESKEWLKRVALKVGRRTDLYARQYRSCPSR